MFSPHDCNISEVQSNALFWTELVNPSEFSMAVGDYAVLDDRELQEEEMYYAPTFSIPRTVGLASKEYSPVTPGISETIPQRADSNLSTSSISLFRQDDRAQTATTLDQQNEPPRNSQGRMICKYGGCEELTFNNKGEWKYVPNQKRGLCT